ncbi:sugar phosphate isomerase/epimerase family protein [Paenibacillus sp. YIM B09110]|uniref:sugar phosphate isomerase/epimerase family protein n=1 Tax=Paenibacillus sp. YIM B09110 TaxID=3126102 RepID=UPI00301E2A2F
MKVAFMTANYVAEALDYKPGLEWGVYQAATSRKFGNAGFASEFERLLERIKELDFDAIELWVAHLDPFTATAEMLDAANRLLRSYKMEVVSYTASFHIPYMPIEDMKRAFETAKALGAPVLANSFHPSNAAAIYELCGQYDIQYGIENHSEKNAQEVINQFNSCRPRIGATLDTGWFATQGYDPIRALQELKDSIVHVHLKDVLYVGGHDSCALGQGIVPIEGVLRKLEEIGYQGYLTIEHEPYDHDPAEDIRESLAFVRGLL